MCKSNFAVFEWHAGSSIKETIVPEFWYSCHIYLFDFSCIYILPFHVKLWLRIPLEKSDDDTGSGDAMVSLEPSIFLLM